MDNNIVNNSNIKDTREPQLKTISDYELMDKKVIIRCDLNVPLKKGVIEDDNRIVESLETIKYAIENGAKVIILSHLGRIEKEEDKQKNSLLLVSKRLSELLEKPVTFVPKTRGIEVETAINMMNNGDIVLLENTRFEDIDSKKESKNDPELSAYWASLGDLYINDAFGAIHRAHASTAGISNYLPSGIGFLVQKEVNILSEVMTNPERPFMVIMGGAKLKEKLAVIENLLTIADRIFIGGGMCYTFFKAKGYNIGKSLVEDEYVDVCKNLLEKYGNKIDLPFDVMVRSEVEGNEYIKNVGFKEIKDHEEGLDIGENTRLFLAYPISKAKTVVWNGPLGMCEIEEFSRGTKNTLSNLLDSGAKVILGGGNIVAEANKFGYKNLFYHASTGGGATLEFMEGKDLPGLAAIRDSNSKYFPNKNQVKILKP